MNQTHDSLYSWTHSFTCLYHLLHWYTHSTHIPTHSFQLPLLHSYHPITLLTHPFVTLTLLSHTITRPVGYAHITQSHDRTGRSLHSHYSATLPNGRSLHSHYSATLPGGRSLHSQYPVTPSHGRSLHSHYSVMPLIRPFVTLIFHSLSPSHLFLKYAFFVNFLAKSELPRPDCPNCIDRSIVTVVDKSGHCRISFWITFSFHNLFANWIELIWVKKQWWWRTSVFFSRKFLTIIE
jgi:hypothetical protein